MIIVWVVLLGNACSSIEQLTDIEQQWCAYYSNFVLLHKLKYQILIVTGRNLGLSDVYKLLCLLC